MQNSPQQSRSSPIYNLLLANDFVKEVEQYIGRKITILHTKTTFDKWFYGKVTRGKAKGQVRGYPLFYWPCWWSREAKFKMLEPVCKGHIRYIGIAADEPYP